MTHFRKLSLIQIHTNRVHLTDRPVEMRLEIPMRPQSLLDVTDPTEFGMQLDGLKVLDVFPLEKHVSDRGCFLVDFEWMTGEDDAFGYDPRWIRWEG